MASRDLEAEWRAECANVLFDFARDGSKLAEALNALEMLSAHRAAAERRSLLEWYSENSPALNSDRKMRIEYLRERWKFGPGSGDKAGWTEKLDYGDANWLIDEVERLSNEFELLLENRLLGGNNVQGLSIKHMGEALPDANDKFGTKSAGSTVIMYERETGTILAVVGDEAGAP